MTEIRKIKYRIIDNIPELQITGQANYTVKQPAN